jgi:hypothetical protein
LTYLFDMMCLIYASWIPVIPERFLGPPLKVKVHKVKLLIDCVLENCSADQLKYFPVLCGSNDQFWFAAQETIASYEFALYDSDQYRTKGGGAALVLYNRSVSCYYASVVRLYQVLNSTSGRDEQLTST